MADPIRELLTRGIEQVLPSKKGLANLMRKRKIRLYNGIDPTGPDLHLGHAVVLRKLKEFQDLGHEVILLVGTFTAQIGDPSDRESPRQPLTPAQIKKNVATYKKQAGKILDLSKIKFVYNADWLAKIGFEDVIQLTSHFSVQQLIERDMFQQRLKKNKPIWLHEFMYPLMQGYDSVHLDVDLEVGATDQTFNMLAGRTLQKIYREKEKYVLTTPMLLGLDGRKMSKTYGNTVNLTDPPNEMYGKLMSLKDELIIHYLELCTDATMKEVKTIKNQLDAENVNPMELKKVLAFKITELIHGASKACSAKKYFETTIQKKEVPRSIKEVKAKERLGNQPNIIDLLKATGLARSSSEARRLIQQGAVRIDDNKIGSIQTKIEIGDGAVLKVGKLKMVRVI